MATQTIPGLTEEEYLALDRANDFRSEFVHGEMLAMSGGSLRHSRVAVRCAAELERKLEGTNCTVFNSGVRVQTALSRSYLYPDLSVVCGEIQTLEKSSDTLINPIVVMEILSPSTRRYDQGAKFHIYREIATLREYLLIDPAAPEVTHYSRQPDNTWVLQDISGMEASFTIPALSVTLKLTEIYRGVFNIPA